MSGVIQFFITDIQEDYQLDLFDSRVKCIGSNAPDIRLGFVNELL